MSDREMIIDLLRDVMAIGFWTCGFDPDTGQPDGYNMEPEGIADYLLENGVTIRAAVPGHCDQHNIVE